jgi:hypothetical protein
VTYPQDVADRLAELDRQEHRCMVGLGVTVAAISALLIGLVIYVAATTPPCVEWGTRTVQHTTCVPIPMGNGTHIQSCTTTPRDERYCVRREEQP